MVRTYKRETHIRAVVVAGCLDCGWSSSAVNAQANAAQHHDRTQHRVRVSVHTVIEYGRDPRQPSLTLLDGGDAA